MGRIWELFDEDYMGNIFPYSLLTTSKIFKDLRSGIGDSTLVDETVLSCRFSFLCALNVDRAHFRRDQIELGKPHRSMYLHDSTHSPLKSS